MQVQRPQQYTQCMLDNNKFKNLQFTGKGRKKMAGKGWHKEKTYVLQYLPGSLGNAKNGRPKVQ